MQEYVRAASNSRGELAMWTLRLTDSQRDALKLLIQAQGEQLEVQATELLVH